MKISLKVLALMLGMFVFATVPATSVQTAKPEFSIDISAPAVVKAGAPISLKITVTNVVNHQITFDSNVLGERDFAIEVLDSQGHTAPMTRYMKAIRGEYEGPGPHIVFAGKLIPKDLKPGESLKETVDVSQLFELKPGVYTVQVWRNDFQEEHVMKGTTTQPEDMDLNKPRRGQMPTPNPKPIPAKPKAIAKSNTLTITVTESDQAIAH